jgi:hypothetical protein
MYLYILTVGLTLLSAWYIINIVNRKRNILIHKVVKKQSNIHEMIKDIIPKQMFTKTESVTQSKKHAQKNMVRLIVHEGKAYWTVDNVFYVAESIDGRIDEETVRPLDTTNMSKKEIEIMMDILDTLREGTGSDDSSSSGN